MSGPKEWLHRLPKLPNFGKEWPLPLLRSSQSCQWIKIDAKERARVCASSLTVPVQPAKSALFHIYLPRKRPGRVYTNLINSGYLLVFWTFFLFFFSYFIQWTGFVFEAKIKLKNSTKNTIIFQLEMKYLSSNTILRTIFLKNKLRIISDKYAQSSGL